MLLLGLCSLSNICTPNSGKAAAKLDLAKLLAASALAAYTGYCKTIGQRLLLRPCYCTARTHAFDEKGEDTCKDPDVAADRLSVLLSVTPVRRPTEIDSPNAKHG